MGSRRSPATWVAGAMVAIIVASCGATADDDIGSTPATTDLATVDGATGDDGPADTPTSASPTEDDEGAGGSPGSSPPGSAPPASRPDWVVVDLLDLVANTEDNLRLIKATDYGRATAAVGLSRPDGTDPEAAINWLRQLVLSGDPTAGVSFVGFDRTEIRDYDGWRRELGFSVLDTDAAVTTGQHPTDITAYAVTVDAERIDGAVRSEPIWGPALELREGPGGPYYFWSGDGLQNHDRATVVRTFGRGGLMAVRQNLVLRSAYQEPFEEALRVHAGGDPVTADPDVLALLGALDRADVYELLITSSRFTPRDAAGPDVDWERFSAAVAAGDYGPGLVPFELLALGTAHSGDRRLTVVATIHATAADAAENTRRLRAIVETGQALNTGEPWSSELGIRSAESQGNLSVTVLESTSQAPAPLYLLNNRESLIWIDENAIAGD